jgi:glutathione S-transferase
MSVKVMQARKKFNVKYPDLYGDSSTANGKAFNCVQRGAQNSYENLSAFHAMLLIAGARYPISASVAAAVYLLGRIFYFRGYCTGDPQGRHQGGFLHLGMLGLVTMAGMWAVELWRSGGKCSDGQLLLAGKCYNVPY